jgi:hypothetical protein
MPSLFALALLASLGATDSVPAQVARFDRMAAAARAVLAADAGRFWGARLDGVEWMAVLRTADGGGGHAYLTASPAGVASGYEPVDAGRLTLYAGALPPGVAPANTSVEWGGRRWAMVVLPLPSDSADAVRLLVHEAMHTLQGRTTEGTVLPSPAYAEGGAGVALLDRPEGRVWLQLEERALHAALLASSKGAQQRALLDALLFRARRYAAATPDERVRERALDVGEGLPEYTAWALTAGTGAAGARAFAPSLERAAAQPSYVRAFPYATGPAYAFLVDRSLSGWRRHVMAHGGAFDLQGLALTTVSGAPPWLAAALGDTAAAATASAPEPLARAADAAAARYGDAALRAAEDARWAAREREIAALRRRFVDGPTLRLRPGALRISFDPRAQTPLGDAGTVMRGLTWKGDAGAELDAPDGALVSPDWSELRVPLDGGVTPPPSAGAIDTTRHWRAAGWSLTLPTGWRIAAEGGDWVARPPRRAALGRGLSALGSFCSARA